MRNRFSACACIVSVVLFPLSLLATNWYVRPTQQGSHTGQDWSNAWDASSITWGSVKPGDTVWLSGGTYGGSINPSSSGSSGSPITIKKVNGDAVPVSAPGYAAAFSGTAAVFSQGFTLTGTNLVLDGNNWTPPGLPKSYGIVINLAGSPNSSTTNRGIDARVGGANMVNVEVAGPGYNVTLFETDGILMGSNSLISGCKIHDMDELIHSYPGVTNSAIEYTTLYNAGSHIVISGLSSDPHPDCWYSGSGTTNTVFRYNVVANIVSEGNFFDNQGAGQNMLFYGNVFFQGDTVPAGCVPIEFQNGYSFGTVFVYNNTFVDWSKGNYLGPGTSVANGSQVANNIFYKCAEWNGLGTNSSPSSNPFVSYKASTQENVPTGYDPTPFAVGFSPKVPIPGTDLGPPYDLDMNGRSIGVGMGALAPSVSSTPSPTAASSPTPKPSSSPTPIPTATPSPTASSPTPPPSGLTIGSSVTPIDQANVRLTPAGTLLGTQNPGSVGVITAGPQSGTLPGAPTAIDWYNCNFQNGADGWIGGNNLQPVTVTPTPAPTATPLPTYVKWEASLNAAVAGGANVTTWIVAHPPAKD